MRKGFFPSHAEFFRNCVLVKRANNSKAMRKVVRKIVTVLLSLRGNESSVFRVGFWANVVTDFPDQKGHFLGYKNPSFFFFVLLHTRLTAVYYKNRVLIKIVDIKENWRDQSRGRHYYLLHFHPLLKKFNGWDLPKRLESLTANANDETVLGSIPQHSGIWGAVDEAVMNKVLKKVKICPSLKILLLSYAYTVTSHPKMLPLPSSVIQLNSDYALGRRLNPPVTRLKMHYSYINVLFMSFYIFIIQC